MSWKRITDRIKTSAQLEAIYLLIYLYAQASDYWASFHGTFLTLNLLSIRLKLFNRHCCVAYKTGENLCECMCQFHTYQERVCSFLPAATMWPTLREVHG